jgi:hypothetical protein
MMQDQPNSTTKVLLKPRCRGKTMFNDLSDEEKIIFWESLKTLAKVSSETPEIPNSIGQR